MTRIYIAGPMSGYEDHNFPAFNEAARQLSDAGYSVLNPAEETGVRPGWTWAQYLKHDLPLMLKCEGVATLDGWEGSRGALLEVHVASQLEMPVRSVAEWIAWDWRKGEAA